MEKMKQNRGQETKEKILNAAISLFSDGVYDRVTMKEIATNAGVKPASIYNHFASKEELLAEIIRYHSQALEELLDCRHIDEIMLRSTDPVDVLRKVVYLETVEEQELSQKCLKIMFRILYTYPDKVNDFSSIVYFHYYRYALDQLAKRGDIFPHMDAYADILYRVVTMHGFEAIYRNELFEENNMQQSICETLENLFPMFLTEQGKKKTSD